MNVSYLEVKVDEEGQRLDNYLIRILKGVPKSHIYRIIRSGEVRVNKKRAAVNTRLSSGDQVRLPPVRMSVAEEVFVGKNLEQQLLASILYEDDNILVINKPRGIAVHGGSGLSLGVIEALRKIRNDLYYLELIHRLDKETSGCLILAKKRSILRMIHALFQSRQIQKSYWALLQGSWKEVTPRIVNIPLEKNILKSGERIVRIHEDGKSSETEYQLIENYEKVCWVLAIPKTGRTHQIRVHSAYLGHPIIGDEKYGADILIEGIEKNRLYLHARAIQFNLNGRDYKFQADLDKSFTRTIEYFRAGMLKKS